MPSAKKELKQLRMLRRSAKKERKLNASVRKR